jgi:hypothetical protein
MSDTQVPNYITKLRKLLADPVLPKDGLFLTDIFHDDWCEIHSGGTCNCDPEIVIHRIDGRDPERN